MDSTASWRTALVMAASGLALWSCGGNGPVGGPNDAHGEEVEWPDADAGAIELVDAGGPNADASATERRDAGEVPEVDAGGSAPLDAGTPDADAGSEQSRDAGPVIAPDSGATEQPDAGPGVLPDGGAVELPIKKGSWTYYGAGQGLPPSVMDVSADEGGNVYVAGGDGLYVKTRTDEHFLRFDSENAGFTKNCNDKSYAHCGKEPSGCAGAPLPKPMYQCRILSVAGASAGKAIIGYEGFGDEIQDWTGWASATGGADVVAFDPGKKTMSRTRHVWIASPPHTVCNGPIGYEGRAPPGYACPTPDRWWTLGRPLVRKIYRIAVNHDASSARYGDAWFCSDHAAFAALFNNAAARKLFDRTAEYPEFADAKDVWEHLHPVVGDPGADWLNEPCFGLSIAPDGLPWATNEYRTPYISYPEADLSWEDFDMSPRVTGTCPAGSSWCPPATYGFDIWPDPWDAAHSAGVYAGATFDAVHSLSHCPDGTLWIGSYQQGLARMDPDRSIHVDTGVKDPIMTVACDPLDSSVWIGFLYGGIGRFHNGVLEHIDVAGAPEFAQSEVQSIQIDRWVTGSRRIIYFAFGPRSDGGRNALGGLGSYDGP